MPNQAPLTGLVWVAFPILAALGFAIAAALHYGTAAMHQAKDLPNLPTAMAGGAVAGALAVLLGLSARALGGEVPFGLGVVFAGLCGEYLGGRCEDFLSACRRGCLCAVILLPLGSLLMAALLKD